MTDTTPALDSVRQRLKLALGAQALLGEEIPGAGCRAFVATMSNGNGAAIVTVHRASGEEPDPGAVHHRFKGLRHLGHGVIDIPLAVGDVDGHAWVLEAVSPLPSARDRLTDGSLPLAHGVSAIRDLCRALVAMHRRGIVHGAISLDTVRISGESARLGGLGQSLRGSVREDVEAMGAVAWSLLSGQVELRSSRPLSTVRRGVSPSLDALFTAFNSPDPRRRPQRAEAILDALDTIPSHRANSFDTIVDAGLRDGRPRRAVAWAVAGAALLLLFALLELRR